MKCLHSNKFCPRVPCFLQRWKIQNFKSLILQLLLPACMFHTNMFFDNHDMKKGDT